MASTFCRGRSAHPAHGSDGASFAGNARAGTPTCGCDRKRGWARAIATAPGGGPTGNDAASGWGHLLPPLCRLRPQQLVANALKGGGTVSARSLTHKRPAERRGRRRCAAIGGLCAPVRLTPRHGDDARLRVRRRCDVGLHPGLSSGGICVCLYRGRPGHWRATQLSRDIRRDVPGINTCGRSRIPACRRASGLNHRASACRPAVGDECRKRSSLRISGRSVRRRHGLFRPGSRSGC